MYYIGIVRPVALSLPFPRAGRGSPHVLPSISTRGARDNLTHSLVFFVLQYIYIQKFFIQFFIYYIILNNMNQLTRVRAYKF